MKWRHVVLVFTIACLVSTIACPVGARPQQALRIAAAADLEPALPPIVLAFQQQTGIRVEVTYQASAVLTTQIQSGAPFDVFLSADVGYPQRLIAAGVAIGPAPLVYARGTLVLWVRKDGPWTGASLDVLRSPHLKRLAIANPDRAPYGRAAVAALKSLKLFDPLRTRLVTAENIAQAAQFVDSGNADAGLLSLTSALTPRLRASGSYVVVPAGLYPPIEQGAVVLKRSSQPATAERFLRFLMSPASQARLREAGLVAGSVNR